MGLKALILVGGYGTRLRPLTLSMPKPLVPFGNKPMLIHQVEALKAVGVTDIVLAVAYRPEAMAAEMEAWGRKLGVTFHFSHETTPLGTAGPLALAAELIGHDSEPFFVLNSDVTCTFPFADLLAFHRAHGGEGTIMVTKVEQWQKYGVVVYEKPSGKISRFAEKPKTFVGDHINAGIYCFNKSILKRIKLEKTSIEMQVFPAMAADNQLFAFELPGFWMDIGQPADYIDGLTKFLPSLAGTARASELVSADEAKAKGFTVNGCVMVHPTAQIDAGAVLGPDVTVGAGCHIGASARLIQCAVFDNSKVGQGTYICKSIIGWNNHIGAWCRLEHGCVFGDDVTVRPELYVNGCRVLPNKSVSASVPQPEILM